MPAGRSVGSYLLGGLVGLALSMVLVTVYINTMRGSETLVSIAPLPATQGGTVTVYVGGAVARPGVYALPRGERVEGAILAAGGFAEDADQEGINRAQLLRDEGQVVVPRKGEPTATPARPAASAAASLATVARTTPPSSAPASGPIDVNRASAEELERLPGVGQKIARDIVAYREANGPFANAADLAEVSGISERMVASWEGMITFGP
jgi:competence protein ComEA